MSVAGSLIVLSYQLRSGEERITETRESADVPRTAPMR